jgi:hypothetical protein
MSSGAAGTTSAYFVVAAAREGRELASADSAPIVQKSASLV